MTKNWQGLEQLGSDIKEIDNHIKGQATDVIESGEVENAKPIYCHPLTMQFKVDTAEYQLTCLIFNNSSSKFTWDTFKQWLNELNTSVPDGRIMMSGTIYDNGVYYPASYLYTSSTQKLVITMGAVTGYTSSKTFILTSSWASINPDGFADGVNKIN